MPSSSHFTLGPTRQVLPGLLSLNWLLLALPGVSLMQTVPGWKNETVIFFLAALSVIPLARWMSQSTDHLGRRFGAGAGGLLNATFGNAPEMIIALVALSNGLVVVVKAAMIGSILGNVLLMLGVSIVVGGARHTHLKFNQTGVRVAATSLVLAVVGLSACALFRSLSEQESVSTSPLNTVRISYIISAVLLVTYVLWLIFSLITHRHLFTGENTDDDGDDPPWPVWKALALLALAALLLTWTSEAMAGGISAVCESFGISSVFVGVIVLAAVGNAGEAATSVAAAWKNRMDLSMSITVGSSLQVAMFVIPVLVFVSPWLGHGMTLDFSLIEITSLALAVGIMLVISGDGECNWVEGAQLLAVYLILAVIFYFLPEPADSLATALLE